MREEENTESIMQNSELSERIFTLFNYKKIKDNDMPLYAHMNSTSEKRGWDINGFNTFNTCQVLRTYVSNDGKEFNGIEYMRYYERSTRIMSTFE